MRLRFTKMHGLGNDFVVIDAISQKVNITPEKVRHVADRHLGVGCDQVLMVELPNRPDADFSYRIFNSDGFEVENCGNGARCFAKFVRDRKLTGKHCIDVQTTNAVMKLTVQPQGDITVDMGVPGLEPSDLPFAAPKRASTYFLDIESDDFNKCKNTAILDANNTHSDQATPNNKHRLKLSAVSVGNPHAVILVDNIDAAQVDIVGPTVQGHPHFPKQVNVGFMQIISRQEVNLRVYERGAGETHACGTGACAAVVAGRLRDLLDSDVKVNLPGGSLSINWAGEGDSVKMTGPATTVFQGQLNL